MVIEHAWSSLRISLTSYALVTIQSLSSHSIQLLSLTWSLSSHSIQLLSSTFRLEFVVTSLSLTLTISCQPLAWTPTPNSPPIRRSLRQGIFQQLLHTRQQLQRQWLQRQGFLKGNLTTPLPRRSHQPSPHYHRIVPSSHRRRALGLSLRRSYLGYSWAPGQPRGMPSGSRRGSDH